MTINDLIAEMNDRHSIDQFYHHMHTRMGYTIMLLNLQNWRECPISELNLALMRAIDNNDPAQVAIVAMMIYSRNSSVINPYHQALGALSQCQIQQREDDYLLFADETMAQGETISDLLHNLCKQDPHTKSRPISYINIFPQGYNTNEEDPYRFHQLIGSFLDCIKPTLMLATQTNPGRGYLKEETGSDNQPVAGVIEAIIRTLNQEAPSGHE